MSKKNSISQTTTLADQLRSAVRDSGMSVNAVAVTAGIPQPVLQRFMNGSRGLSLNTAQKLASAFSMRLTKPSKKPKIQEQ